MSFKKRPDLEKASADFIKGAEAPAEKSRGDEYYPWRDANPRIKKGINLRLDEVQWAKLRFISEKTPYSIQKFIMSVLEPAIEEEIQRLIGKK